MSKISRNNKRRKKSNLMKKSRWAGYAAAGAATALTGQEAVEAGITHVDPVDIVVAAPIPASGQVTSLTQLDLNGDGQLDVQLKQENLNSSGQANAFVDVLSNSVASFGVNGIAGFYGSYGRYAYNMSPGDCISANSPSYQSSYYPGFLVQYGWMASGGGTYASEFNGAGPGYLGIKFDSAAGTHYAWIRVEMTGSSYNGITITDWAYGDVDEKILVGQTTNVPEPGSLGLLAIGGAGLLAWRRKRAQAAQEASN